MWFQFVVGQDRKRLYVQAEDKDHALDRARGAGYEVTNTFWGPFTELWECTAKERFCDFSMGIWKDVAPKDKHYKKLYVSLDKYLERPGVLVVR